MWKYIALCLALVCANIVLVSWYYSNVVTVQKLNQAGVWNLSIEERPAGFTCAHVCAEVGRACVLGYRAEVQKGANRIPGLSECNEPVDKEAKFMRYDCYCY